MKDRYQNCSDLLIDLRAIKDGQTPPLAHKDVFHSDDLASMAQEEVTQVETVIPEHTRAPGASFSDHVFWPPFLVVVGLLFISVMIHILT